MQKYDVDLGWRINFDYKNMTPAWRQETLGKFPSWIVTGVVAAKGSRVTALQVSWGEHTSFDMSGFGDDQVKMEWEIS